MASEILVPTLGESVSEATVSNWLKKPGDAVAIDEPLLELETDKVTLEVNATTAGVLNQILAEAGATVAVGAVLGMIDESGSAAVAPAPTAAPAPSAVPELPKAATAPGNTSQSPAVAKLLAENQQVDAASLAGSGKDGRLTKGDVLAAAAAPVTAPAPAPAPIAGPAAPRETGPREERVRMTRLRQTIARRLKEAQNTAAMLTTFNEVDMSAVMDTRKRLQDDFVAKHGVKLGFMSFFVKAVVAALKDLPAVNAEIDGSDIIYKNYFNIGVAVGTPSGLVVPVLRDADAMGFADIEKTIADFGKRARDGKLAMADMQGGTFTISNGGIYGSLNSTPILNTPQSGILGMHKIQERPMVENGQIVIRPMMYLAMSYDHRIIDGREAVTFLVKVKDALEAPERLLFDL